MLQVSMGWVGQVARQSYLLSSFPRQFSFFVLLYFFVFWVNQSVTDILLGSVTDIVFCNQNKCQSCCNWSPECKVFNKNIWLFPNILVEKKFLFFPSFFGTFGAFSASVFILVCSPEWMVSFWFGLHFCIMPIPLLDENGNISCKATRNCFLG